jgi:hypothetical protein
MRRSEFMLVALVAVSVSCGKKPTEPAITAGVLTVVLTTPNADDGALLVSVTGGEIDSISVPAGSDLQMMVSTTTPRVVLVRGTITAGAIAKVWVDDVNATYTASITQAASKTTYAQRTLAGYSVTVEK